MALEDLQHLGREVLCTCKEPAEAGSGVATWQRLGRTSCSDRLQPVRPLLLFKIIYTNVVLI